MAGFKVGDTVEWRRHGEYRPEGSRFVLLDKAPARRDAWYAGDNSGPYDTKAEAREASDWSNAYRIRNLPLKNGDGTGQAWWLQDALTGRVSEEWVARESELTSVTADAREEVAA